MFKKKTNLPPRPKYPSNEQIIEDLLSTSSDDPLFSTARMISEKKFKSDQTEQNDTYQKIRNFLTLQENLQETMKSLDSVYQNLAEKKEDLIKLSDSLKDQASQALV